MKTGDSCPAGRRRLHMNVQPQIEKVFEIANLLKGMKLFAGTKEADEYFDAIQKSVLESST